MELLNNSLNDLYFNGSRESRQNADFALRKFQESNEAWEICGEVIQKHQQGNVGSQLEHIRLNFCALTLHTKCSQYWEQLNVEQQEMISNLLLESVLLFPKGVVKDRLCMAYSLVSIKSMRLLEFTESQFSQIKFWITLFTKGRANVSEENVLNSFLLWLRFLLEQIDDDSIFSKQEIDHYLKLLNCGLSEILKFLLSIQQNGNYCLQVRKSGLIVLHSLVMFGVTFEIILQKEVIDLLFTCLQERELFQNSVNVLLEIFTRPISESHINNILRIFEKLSDLLGFYRDCLKRKDSFICQEIARLTFGTAESQCHILASFPVPQVGKLLNLVLELCQYPSKEIFSLSLDFWYSLQSKLETAEQNKIFSKLYISLLDISLYQFSLSSIGNAQDLMDFRVQYADFFMEIYQSLSSSFFSILHEKIKTSKTWVEIEVILFAVLSSADMVDDNHVKSIFPILEVQSEFSNHPLVKFNLMQITGRYSEKFAPIVSEAFVIQAIESTLTAFKYWTEQKDLHRTLICSENFLEICSNYQKILSQDNSILENLIRSYLNYLSQFDIRLLTPFLKGISYLTCNSSEDIQKEVIFAILQPIVNLISRHLDNPSDISSKVICNELDKFRCTLIGFDGEKKHASLYLIITNVWPIIPKVMMKCYQDAKIMDSVCNLLVNIIVSLGFHPETSEFMREICSFIGKIYQNSTTGDVLSVFIVLSASTPFNMPHLSELYQQFPEIHSRTMNILAIQNNPDEPSIIVRYFKLISNLLEFHPKIFFQDNYDHPNNPLMNQTFRLVIKSLNYPSKPVSYQVIQFLNPYLMKPRDFMSPYLDLYFRDLVSTSLNSLIFNPTSNRLHLLKLSFSLKSYNPRMMQIFTLNLLSNADRKEFSFLSQNFKQRFCSKVIKAKSRAAFHKALEELQSELITIRKMQPICSTPPLSFQN